MFFRWGFQTARWFCDGVPYYSTSLWYLEKKKELNLLAFAMKENRSHRYEAYIAAGNMYKLVSGGNEAARWFLKAAEEDPRRPYAHALLGYEAWEIGNYLVAKKHFYACIAADPCHYLGW